MSATATVKETATALRTNLRTAFPNTRFSVTMSKGTAYGWLNVRWTDGPPSEAVEAITRKYEYTRFDGQTDSYHTVAGNEAWGACGINNSRTISDAAVAKLVKEVSYTADGEPFLGRDGIDTMGDTPERVAWMHATRIAL